MNKFGFIKLFTIKAGEQTLLAETGLSPNRKLIVHWIKYKEHPHPSDYLLTLSDHENITLLTKFISKEDATRFIVSMNSG